MEYALLGIFCIFRELLNTLMGLVVNEEDGVTIGTIFIALLILWAFFNGMKFIDKKVDAAKRSEGE